MSVWQGRVIPASVPMRPALDDQHRRSSADLSMSNSRPRVIPAEAMVLIEEARQLKRPAEREAQDIVRQAREQAEALRQQTDQEAKRQASLELASQRLVAERQLARFDDVQLERTVQLARLLAERVLRDSLTHAPEHWLRLAQVALDNFRRARQTRLFVHPEQLPVIQEILPKLKFSPGSVSVHPDPNMLPGDLRVVSDMGDLTFSVAKQLDRLVEAVMKPQGSG